jgi:protein TonB
MTGFLRRLHEFLTERPVKLPASYAACSLGEQHFGAGFRENLREFFRPAPPLPGGAAKSRMAVDWKPGLGTFWENLRDMVSPPKLPPLKLSGPPVKVKDIWSKDELFAPAQSLSFLVHVLAGLLIIIPIAQEVLTPTQAKNVIPVDLNAIDISPYITKIPAGGKDKSGGGGGGGERNPSPASKGRLPRFSLQPQLTPPVVQIKNPDPKLPVEATVFVPPDIRVPQPNLPNIGDPLAGSVTNSGGPGSGGGIGTGTGGGVGSGSGPGVGPGWGGGIGGGAFHIGNGIGEPACIYCPTPQFSEEARKAKHQGSVVLRLIVQPDGRATNISVVKGLGLGLDEKAMEAVRNWRFKPSIGPGNKPVPVWLDIEVVFRLL